MRVCTHTYQAHWSGRLSKHITCGAVTLTLGGTVTKKKKLNREPEDRVFNFGYAKAAYFLCALQFSFLKKKVIYQMFPKLLSNRHFKSSLGSLRSHADFQFIMFKT